MHRLIEKYNRLVSFDSVHQSIKAEIVLKEIKVDFMLVPTPRVVSVSCGQCIFYSEVLEKEIFALFKEKKIKWSRVFSFDEKNECFEEILLE